MEDDMEFSFIARIAGATKDVTMDLDLEDVKVCMGGGVAAGLNIERIKIGAQYNEELTEGIEFWFYPGIQKVKLVRIMDGEEK